MKSRSTIGAAALLVPALLAGQIVPAPGNGPQGGGNPMTGWNISYQTPSGWRVGQNMGRLQMLVSNSDAGAIFLAPGLYASAQDAIADLSAFYQSMQMQAFPVEQPAQSTIAGMRALTATYASQTAMGQVMHGRFICLMTSHGTGLNLLAMTTPDQLPKLRATLEAIAASVKAQPPSVNQRAVAALAGRWIYYEGKSNPVTTSSGGSSRSHEETVVFDGRGSYQWQSSSQVSVTTPGMSGGASGASGDADQGSYTVIGNTLVFKGTKGQLAVDFQFDGQRIVAAGKTYIRQ